MTANTQTTVPSIHNAPYIFMSEGINPGMSAEQVEASREMAAERDEFTTELEAFEHILGLSARADRYTMKDRVRSLAPLRGLWASQQANIAIKRVAHHLERDDEVAAARSSFKLGNELWSRGLYDMAVHAFVFGAALNVGFARRKVLDFSNSVVRGPLFAQLERAGVAEQIDTSRYPAKLGMGYEWMIFSKKIGGFEFGSYSRMLVGAWLVLKTFSRRRIGLPSPEGFSAQYHVSADGVRAMMKKELADLKAMESKGMPVVGVHHVDENDLSYVRDYIHGTVIDGLKDPLLHLSQDERLYAENKATERAMAIRKAGLWQGATVEMMLGSMAYSLADRKWVVFDTLASARRA